MFNIVRRQGTASQNHKEIPLLPSRMTKIKESDNGRCGEGSKQLEFSDWEEGKMKTWKTYTSICPKTHTSVPKYLSKRNKTFRPETTLEQEHS